MEPLVTYFKDIKINSVLDVGTGTGKFINVLKNTFPKAKITAVDPDVSSLEEARELFPEVDFLEMSGEKLNFDDNKFDAVSISMALHHLPKVQKGLRELKRVVKPGGYIIINEPISSNLNSSQEVHKMFHHFRSRIDRITGSFHRKTFSKDAILQMLKVAELPIQFYFERRNNVNLIKNKNELEIRVEKMKSMLEKIKDLPEYNILLPQIEEFRQKALKYGFQPATNLIIVIRKR